MRSGVRRCGQRPSPAPRRGASEARVSCASPRYSPQPRRGEARGKKGASAPGGTGPRQTEQAAERRGPPGQALPPPAPTVPRSPGGPAERAPVAERAPLQPSTHHSWWPRGSPPPSAGPDPTSRAARSRAGQRTHSAPELRPAAPEGKHRSASRRGVAPGGRQGAPVRPQPRPERAFGAPPSLTGAGRGLLPGAAAGKKARSCSAPPEGRLPALAVARSSVKQQSLARAGGRGSAAGNPEATPPLHRKPNRLPPAEILRASEEIPGKGKMRKTELKCSVLPHVLRELKSGKVHVSKNGYGNCE